MKANIVMHPWNIIMADCAIYVSQIAAYSYVVYDIIGYCTH